MILSEQPIGRMRVNAPAVTVSSTFYDLAQIRADLLDFLQDEIGYRPLLSEYPSFPIDPDADTIENCKRRVEQDADILVLVIGGRYGYVDKASDKSVTNLEYLAARAKGIPIYIFVDRNIMAVLPVWRSNPSGDFSGAVDNVRLFEFVEQVRSEDRVWTQEFGRAQDIVAALRTQFAYLMLQGLQWRTRLRSQPLRLLTGLHGEALRLALERPKGWEYLLLGQVLCDEVEENEDLRREHRLGMLLGSGEQVAPESTGRWLMARLGELRNVAYSLDILVNRAWPEALREPGTPADVTEIVFVARKIASVHRHAIEWSQRVRKSNVEERFVLVRNELAQFSDSMIENIENFGPSFLRQVNEALATPIEEGEEQRVIEATLTIELSNLDRFSEEIDRLAEDGED